MVSEVLKALGAKHAKAVANSELTPSLKNKIIDIADKNWGVYRQHADKTDDFLDLIVSSDAFKRLIGA